ncbi:MULTISPECIES: IclR family transcriptional regulator domain-containing protein [unclassified Streptomyces]|uniref:IclR family transcriptional regulator domain-containing protein n=1 Tax=unclassified Streptomyces TaxID=2593676 RepID=UPI002E2D5D0D|nr:IclR family transcriptional regulator C-terminal domain-containing protein [Streptomyces sp. NBC_01439]
MDSTDPVRAALAALLRGARGRARLTYALLALRTTSSAATLKRAASGKEVPALATVTEFLSACGATQEEVTMATYLAEAAHGQPRDVPACTVIEPAGIFTEGELNSALVSLHRNAGRPSYRQVQSRGGSEWLAPSSIWAILRNQRLPASQGQMAAFLRGCDVAEEQQGSWLAAWDRAKRPHAMPGALCLSGSSGSHAPSGRYAATCLPRVTRRGTEMHRERTAPVAVPVWWEAARWASDLVGLIDAAHGIDTRSLARRAGLSLDSTTRLLEWLRRQGLVATVSGAHFPGPALEPLTRPGRPLLGHALARLRDEVGAAVYLSSYTDGDVQVRECSYSKSAPLAEEWVPFSAAGHASAVGKILLAQLDGDARMDHLTRHPAVRLTERTITDPLALFENLDRGGPRGAQFSLLEYSLDVVCAAVPLGLPGQVSGLALSLPASQYPRLLTAAQRLPDLAPTLLLARLLDDRPDPTTATGRWPELLVA